MYRANLNHASGCQQHTYGVAAYAGQAITLKFTGVDDNEYQTSFVVDDTALNDTALNVTALNVTALNVS